MQKNILTLTAVAMAFSAFAQHTAGDIDATFNSPFAGTGPSKFLFQSDGKIIAGGSFTNTNNLNNRIARLNANGSFDNTYNNGGSGFNNVVLDMAMLPNEKVVAGGAFLNFNITPTICITRLNTDGTVDAAFDEGSGCGSTVNAVLAQADEKVIVGGVFTTYQGMPAVRCARLNTDGSLDTAFNNNLGTGFDFHVNDMALQADGKIVAVGSFSTVDGASAVRIARLNSNGALDTSFHTGTGFDAVVSTVLVQDDGKILVGGNFTNYNGNSANRLVRLNADGSIDNSFDIGTGFNAQVTCLAQQPDGKILVGGGFTTYNSATANGLLRLNTDGSADNSLVIGAGFNGLVRTVDVYNGMVYVGGDFATYKGTTVNYCVRLYGSNVSGIKNTQSVHFQVFPNPATNTITVNDAPLGADVRLSNLYGQELLRSQITHTHTSLALPVVPAGVYLLSVGDATQRIVIQQ